MFSLIKQTCQPCKSGVKPLNTNDAQAMLEQLNGWFLSDDNKAIQQDFCFKNYYQTIAFVNAVAWIAHQQNHHPEMNVSHGHCLINYSTHTIDGLSENDFICAAKIDALFATHSQETHGQT